MPDLPERIADKIDAEGLCWVWTGSRNRDGYGRVKFRGKTHSTHRLVPALLGIEMIPGMVTDHLCRNRACCNPDHLEQVTAAENTRRGVSRNALRTHCPQGHPYSGGNLYINPSTNGRHCRTCEVARVRRRRAMAAHRTNLNPDPTPKETQDARTR